MGDVAEARKLFELGVARFPNDDRIWDRYIDFEKRKAGGARVEELINRRNLLKVQYFRLGEPYLIHFL